MKEKYKELKMQMINLQSALRVEKFNRQIEINLVKTSFLKLDGSKFIDIISKLELSFDLKIEEEQKLNAFLDKYWNQIPDNLKSVQKQIIRDKENKFQEVYGELGFEIQYIEMAQANLKLNQATSETKLSSTKKIITYVKNLNLDLFRKGVRNFLNNMMMRIAKKSLGQFTVGQQFQAIQNYKKWGEDQDTTISHHPGQVLLLIYWTCQNAYQREAMIKIIEFLNATQNKWENEVKFIFLSLIKEEEAIEFMQNQFENLKCMESYFPKENPYKETLLYELSSPHIILIDKFGIVRTVDYQSYNVLDIESQVEQLINQQVPISLLNNDEDSAEDFINGRIPLFEITENAAEQVLNLIQDSKTQKKKINEIDKTNVFEFEIKFEKVKIGEQVKYKQPILSLSVQYYSPFKKEHVCVECAEFDDKTKRGNDKFKYLNTLIFTNGPLTDQSVLNNFDAHKVGRNLQLKEGEEGTQFHSIMCNGCLGAIEGPRYIAANARFGKQRENGYIDLCQECFQILKEKKSDKAQASIEKNLIEGMSEDNLLVRILFNHGNYFEF